MRYRVVYTEVKSEDGARREIIVEAEDEGGAYDLAMDAMHEDEALIEVALATA